MKERRTKQEIYVDILNSISNSTEDSVKLTRVQLASKLSYDKAKEHLTVLEKYGLVESKPVIKITDKGRSFMNESQELRANIKHVNQSYLTDTSDVDENMIIKAQTGDETKYFLHNSKDDVTVEFTMLQKIKDQQQVQFALQAIIEELE